MPESLTSKRRLNPPVSAPASARVARSTTSPFSVNFKALPTRLLSTWRRRPGSPRSRPGTSGWMRQASSSPLTWACSFEVSITSRMARRRSKSTLSSSRRPASILEKSRMSLMISSRACPEPAMISAYSRCSAVRSVSSSRRVMPITPFMGVRISWLMLAMNWVLRRSASSAWRRAVTSTSMFWATAATPSTPPWGLRQGWAVKRMKAREPSPSSTSSSRSDTRSPSRAWRRALR